MPGGVDQNSRAGTSSGSRKSASAALNEAGTTEKEQEIGGKKKIWRAGNERSQAAKTRVKTEVLARTVTGPKENKKTNTGAGQNESATSKSGTALANPSPINERHKDRTWCAKMKTEARDRPRQLEKTRAEKREFCPTARTPGRTN
jgi:hypothetical protein